MPEKLFGDEVRIRQIIVNLLTNAVKYTKEGAVIVWFGWERIDEDQALLKISVQDTGIGIRKEDMNRLFDLLNVWMKEKIVILKELALALRLQNIWLNL